MIISFNRSPQTYLVVLIITLAILTLIMQISRYAYDKPRRTRTDSTLFVLEFLTVIFMMICVVALVFVYQGYIPWDSPGYLPYISEIGVIAANADPSKYAVTPSATYPATTFAQAVTAYRNSPTGFATRVFSWDGLVVTILKAEAAVNLGHSAAPPGTSWVFQDLNTAVSS